MRWPSRPLITIILCVALVSGILLLANNHIDFLKPIEAISPNDQVFYAEVSSSLPQTLFPAVPSAEKINLPILVYHIVRPSYPSDSRAVRALAHTPEVFDAEMKYLGEAGYHVVSFNDLENYFHNGTPLPQNPIILSFDDGWSDQFRYAFPLLEKYHYLATFFVFTNPIGRHSFLSWDNLRTLLKAGMTIGGHSRSHPYLTKITNDAALWDEINGSKQTLEKNLSITVNEFAYPFGQYNAATIAMVEKAGYRSARGDYYNKGEQSMSRLYELDALNAPTTTALFAQKFPAR